MTIQEQLNRLIKLSAGLPGAIDEILKKNEGTIVGMLKLRLYNYGTDGNYDLIGLYAPSTIERKKSSGQKYNFITLRESGSFYAGMFLETSNAEYEINSRDSKTSYLVDAYGESILELTPKQQFDVIENIIEPELQKLLDNAIGDIEINL